ncbi:MAG: hypothetical protein ACT4OJ_14930 [Bacteroidota bacterium]
MEELKEEKALKEFSWKAIFIVTAFSSFLFSGILKLLEENSSGFFLKTGVVSTSISLLLVVLGKPAGSRKKRAPEETL